MEVVWQIWVSASEIFYRLLGEQNFKVNLSKTVCREKYPNQKIAIQVRTVRAPSIVLSQAKGGSATLDLIADADIYIDGTNNKVKKTKLNIYIIEMQKQLP